MDSKYDNTNKGGLFQNDYKEQGDNKPDFTGRLDVEGKEYKLAAWKKETDGGKKYFSLSLTDPDKKYDIKNNKLGAGFAHKDTKIEQKDDELPF